MAGFFCRQTSDAYNHLTHPFIGKIISGVAIDPLFLQLCERWCWLSGLQRGVK